MCYPDFNIATLIPATVRIQSTLPADKMRRAQLHLMILDKLFHEYSPIRSTFASMVFMLQNPHLMRKFVDADSRRNNGLGLTDAEPSVQQYAMQLLRQFEAFVKSFNVGALLESAAQVPLDVVLEAVPHLEQLNAILGRDGDFGDFIQGLTFVLALQQSTSASDGGGYVYSWPKTLQELEGVLLTAKGGAIKNAGKMADKLFENVKDVNDVVQRWTSMFKALPVLGMAVDPIHAAVNRILDGIHMVVGDTAEVIGDSLQSEGKKLLSRAGKLSSFVNDEELRLDGVIRT